MIITLLGVVERPYQRLAPPSNLRSLASSSGRLQVKIIVLQQQNRAFWEKKIRVPESTDVFIKLSLEVA